MLTTLLTALCSPNTHHIIITTSLRHLLLPLHTMPRGQTIKGVPGLDFGDKVFRPPAVNFLMDVSSHVILSQEGYQFGSRADDVAACIAEANLNRLLFSAKKHKDKWTGPKKEGKAAFLRAICEDLSDGTPGIVEFLLQAAMTARRRYRNRVKKEDKMKWWEEQDDVMGVPAVAAVEVLCRHEATLVKKGL